MAIMTHVLMSNGDVDWLPATVLHFEPLLSNSVSSSANRHRTGLRATIPAAQMA